MPFDFNDAGNALTPYGIFPQTPFPLELSIYGYCTLSCGFCFANRGRDAAGRVLNKENSTAAVFRKIDRETADPESPIGFFLREKYPVCFSNRTDPFQRDEKTYRASEATLAWAKSTRTPLYIQTRGNVLFDEFERYAPSLIPGKDVVYISICQLSDKDRKFHEPGALSLEKRWELARRLTDHGIPVIAACNPYLKDWVGDPYEYCRLAREAGCRGVWLEALHFTGAQADTLAKPYRDLLPKANLQPMYMIGQLKHWYAATAEHDLDFFPTPRWDAYHNHPARHPECADPAWLGGKTLDFNFRLLKAICRISQQHDGAQVLFGWPQVKQTLSLLGVPNPSLRVDPFWYPYNASVKADHKAWRAQGRVLPFWDILRYFWNHPWENQHLVWYHPLVQALWNDTESLYACDDDGDLVAVYNPKVRHHGTFTLNASEVDLDNILRPNFGSVAATP